MKKRALDGRMDSPLARPGGKQDGEKRENRSDRAINIVQWEAGLVCRNGSNPALSLPPGGGAPDAAVFDHGGLWAAPSDSDLRSGDGPDPGQMESAIISLWNDRLYKQQLAAYRRQDGRLFLCELFSINSIMGKPGRYRWGRCQADGRSRISLRSQSHTPGSGDRFFPCRFIRSRTPAKQKSRQE